MIHATKGIVLNTIKYGETSVITHIFTELFGLQTYMVKGVRNSKNKSSMAIMLQPASVLDLVVYHHPEKNFQIIKESTLDLNVKPSESVFANCIKLFSVELLLQLCKTNNPQAEFFEFVYTFLHRLSITADKDLSNFPLWFVIRVAQLSGYEISGTYTTEYCFLDLTEGRFTNTKPTFPPFVESNIAAIMDKLTNLNDDDICEFLFTNNKQRNDCLQQYLLFLSVHLTGFKPLKSLPILATILH